MLSKRCLSLWTVRLCFKFIRCEKWLYVKKKPHLCPTFICSSSGGGSQQSSDTVVFVDWWPHTHRSHVTKGKREKMSILLAVCIYVTKIPQINNYFYRDAADIDLVSFHIHRKCLEIRYSTCVFAWVNMKLHELSQRKLLTVVFRSRNSEKSQSERWSPQTTSSSEREWERPPGEHGAWLISRARLWVRRGLRRRVVSGAGSERSAPTEDDSDGQRRKNEQRLVLGSEKKWTQLWQGSSVFWKMKNEPLFD